LNSYEYILAIISWTVDIYNKIFILQDLNSWLVYFDKMEHKTYIVFFF